MALVNIVQSDPASASIHTVDRQSYTRFVSVIMHNLRMRCALLHVYVRTYIATL